MCLNEELLERVEEFFDLIVCDEDHLELNSAMDSLRCFLERDIDGWTNHSSEYLASAVQNRMEEIWDLIPDTEKADGDLQEYFEDFIESLEELTSPEEAEFEGDDAMLDDDDDSDERVPYAEAEEEEPWD